jgi:hypothetical protein
MADSRVRATVHIDSRPDVVYGLITDPPTRKTGGTSDDET